MPIPPTALEKRLYTALKAISTNKHICLSDLVYRVRENEGKGWEGPQVKKWGKAVEMVENAIQAYEDNISPR